MLRSTIKRFILIFMVLTLTILLAVPKAIAMGKVENIEMNLLQETTSTAERIHFIKHYNDEEKKMCSDRNGDAILIESNGKFGLVDTGSSEGVKSVVKYLNNVLTDRTKWKKIRFYYFYTCPF